MDRVIFIISLLFSMIPALNAQKVSENCTDFKFFIHATGGVNFTHRQFKIDDRGFNQPGALQVRSNNEYPIIGSILNITIGVRVWKNNYITLPLVNLNQGFKSIKSDVDWYTGLPISGPGQTFQFNYKGLGIGYGYNNLRKSASARIDAQLLWMKLRKIRNTYNELSRDLLNDQYLIGCLGIGANFKLKESISMGLVPTVYYGFTPLQRGLLKTHLYNIGLNVSIVAAR